MTELFRAPTAQKFNLDNYAFVFKKEDFKDLSKIVFKNSWFSLFRNGYSNENMKSVYKTKKSSALDSEANRVPNSTS